MQRGQGRDIDQVAGCHAGRRLERLIGPVGGRAVNSVQERFHHLEVAAGGGHQGLRQQQPGAGPDHLSGEDRQPPVDGSCLAAIVDHIEVLLDDPGRPEHLPGGGRVADGVIGQPVVLVPGCRVAVQIRHAAGLLFLQAGAEQVGEQVMVAPPAAHLIQRDQEQAGPLRLLQQPLAALAAGDRIAQRAAEPVEHRRLEREDPHLLILPLEHLLSQIIKNVPVAAGKGGHEPGHIVVPAQRQPGQLQPRRPPLGPGRQSRRDRIGQSQAGPCCDVPQQRRRLAGSEPQLGRSQLGQLPAGPQPRQRQRRIAPAGQHQVNPRRPVLGQEPERLVHGLGAYHVIVIKDEQRPIRLGGQLIDQGRHQAPERGRCGRAEQRCRPFADPGPGPVQRGHRVAPEPGWVVIARVQRQPCGRELAVPGPVSQQDRLAVPGRPADQDQPARQALVEPSGQPRPRHQARLRRGHVQLGSQQGVLRRHGNPG